MPDLSKFSFCIPRYAGPLRAFCVRPVRGPRGADIDTSSLCGRVIPRTLGGPGGHDESRPVTEDILDDKRFVCPECAHRLRAGK